MNQRFVVTQSGVQLPAGGHVALLETPCPGQRAPRGSALEGQWEEGAGSLAQVLAVGRMWLFGSQGLSLLNFTPLITVP